MSELRYRGPRARALLLCLRRSTGPPGAPHEVRKLVTVLFSDLVGSTTIGEHLDPESLRRLLTRYFEEMKAVLERHGGTVREFLGDAVMAVFGTPVVHEDDALRAVRAASEMRERLEALNDELERTWGIRLAARTGLNTGEVVAGDAATSQTHRSRRFGERRGQARAGRTSR